MEQAVTAFSLVNSTLYSGNETRRKAGEPTGNQGCVVLTSADQSYVHTRSGMDLIIHGTGLAHRWA